MIPASCMAASLSSALPEPPEMIAPACPMRRPGGAVCPAIKPTTGLLHVCLHVSRRGFFRAAADLADHDDGVRIRILIEEPNGIREAGADDRVAADPDTGRLSNA